MSETAQERERPFDYFVAEQAIFEYLLETNYRSKGSHAAREEAKRILAALTAPAAPEAPLSDMESTVRAVLTVAESHDDPDWNTVADACRIALRPSPAARQPGADAELVERLRAASNGDLNDFRPGGAERTVDEMMTLCAQAADAIARLSAPAGPGSEGGELERVCRRCRLPEREHRPGYAAHRCAGWVPGVSVEVQRLQDVLREVSTAPNLAEATLIARAALEGERQGNEAP